MLRKRTRIKTMATGLNGSYDDIGPLFPFGLYHVSSYLRRFALGIGLLEQLHSWLSSHSLYTTGRLARIYPLIFAPREVFLRNGGCSTITYHSLSLLARSLSQTRDLRDGWRQFLSIPLCIDSFVGGDNEYSLLTSQGKISPLLSTLDLNKSLLSDQPFCVGS